MSNPLTLPHGAAGNFPEITTLSFTVLSVRIVA